MNCSTRKVNCQLKLIPIRNSLRKIITAVIAATTIGSFSSLGVSAATFDSNISNYYNTIE